MTKTPAVAAEEASEEMVVGPGTERDYATLGKRALAALLDNSVWLFAYMFFFAGVIGAVAEENPEAGGILLIVYLSLWFNYFAFCEWRWGQTIGKNATRIMVVSDKGGRVSFGQASMRGLLRLIDWLVIGWVMIVDRETEPAARRSRGKDRRRPAPGPDRLDHGQGARARGPPDRGRCAERRGADPELSGRARSAAPTPGGRAGAADEERPNEKRPGIRGRLPAITWTLKDTIWGTVAGLILAVLSTILVLPFDPDSALTRVRTPRC